jgi:hypothetical protein
MSNDFCLKVGKSFFAIAILGMGVLHAITGHFTDEVFPVAASVPGRLFLAYLNGITLIIAGTLIVTKKYTQPGGFPGRHHFFIIFTFPPYTQTYCAFKDAGRMDIGI